MSDTAHRLVVACLPLLWSTIGWGQSTPSHGHRPGGPPGIFQLAVPDHPYDLILARPEAESMALSVLAYADMDGSVAYGTAPGTHQTIVSVPRLRRGVPALVEFKSLRPATRYSYQLTTTTSAGVTSKSPDFTFETARRPGDPFVFTMTADAHLDEHTSPAVYLQTLANIRADHPDFHVDLGNLFMTDKHATRGEAAEQYLAQRYYLGQIGCSTPVLLALGVHDGESGRDDDGTDGCLAAWSNRMRTSLFPNPLPDPFYTGNAMPKWGGKPPQNYFAWTWGDALFVVLDPFANSSPGRGGGGGGRDGWGWSLGQAQYAWLARTLSRSTARFKFVFLHNLLRGDQASRGGVEFAGFNEWGGKNADGSDGFAAHRPGWPLPVHRLLVRNHVTAVFRAHDNFFARQELDGITYQMIPQPSFAGDDRIHDLDAYGYKTGTFLGNSGHVRVTVGPERVHVDYVRSRPTSSPSAVSDRQSASFSYSIDPDSGHR